MRAASNCPFFLRLFITYESEISPDSLHAEPGARQVFCSSSMWRTQGQSAFVRAYACPSRMPNSAGSWLRSAGKLRAEMTTWAWSRSGCHDEVRIHRPGITSREIKALTLRKTGSMSVIAIFRQ
jgi:hypothetical protein